MTDDIEEKTRAVFAQQPEPKKPLEYPSYSNYPDESSNTSLLPYLLIFGGIVILALILLFKPFSVSGVCPEVKCGNQSLSCPSIPVCPNPVISMNYSTPNLTCPTMICNPTYNLNCYGNLSSTNASNVTCTNYTFGRGWFNISLVEDHLNITFYNGSVMQRVTLFTIDIGGNVTYFYNQTIENQTRGFNTVL